MKKMKMIQKKEEEDMKKVNYYINRKNLIGNYY